MQKTEDQSVDEKVSRPDIVQLQTMAGPMRMK